MSAAFIFSLGFSTRALIVALTKALRVFGIDPTLSFLLRLPQHLRLFMAQRLNCLALIGIAR